MKKIFFTLMLAVASLSFSPLMAQDVPDPKGVELLNNFMKALTSGDFETSAKAVQPYLHRTLLNAAGTDLTTELRNFSFKKAHTGGSGYEIPVNVTRVRKTGQTQIGFKETAEEGAVYDYFIAKKAGVTGMPAPVKIFFPKNGGAPSISYIGSL